MRRLIVVSFLAGLCLPLLPANVRAAHWEFHPGVYASYEHSDNYLDDAHEELRESTYAIGPSLSLRRTSSILTWDLAGYATRTYHRRFNREESPEERLTTSATLSGVRNDLTLDYAYVQTRERESLDQSRGIFRTLSGGATLEQDLSSAATAALEYVLSREYAPYPDDDHVSQSGFASLRGGLGPRWAVTLRSGYTTHRYTEDTDTGVALADLSLRYAITPRAGGGLELGHEHHRREREANEDIYRAEIFADYRLSADTDLHLSLGQSWFSQDHRWIMTAGGELYRFAPATRDTVSATAEMTHAVTDVTALSIVLAQGYTQEFTTYRSGITKTRSAGLTGEHAFSRTLSVEAAARLIERTPPFEGAIETEITAETGLNWSPWRYLTMRFFLERLQYRYALSGTQKNVLISSLGPAGYLEYKYYGLAMRSENRYGMSIEVRY